MKFTKMYYIDVHHLAFRNDVQICMLKIKIISFEIRKREKYINMMKNAYNLI